MTKTTADTITNINLTALHLIVDTYYGQRLLKMAELSAVQAFRLMAKLSMQDTNTKPDSAKTK